MKKVLVVAPFAIWPPHFGSSERVYNFMKQLAVYHHLHLFVLYTDYTQVVSSHRQKESWPNIEIIPVAPRRRWAQAINPLLVAKGLSLITQEAPDLILCEHLWASVHALLLHALTGVPYILDDHNAEYVRFGRMGRRTAPLIRLLERLVCHFARAVICVSEVDREHLSRLGTDAAKVSVIHNGVNTTQYRPNPAVRSSVRRQLGLPNNSPMLLFFGKLDYQPNAEAVEILTREIMPRVLEQLPEAHFVICGYNPPIEQYAHPRLVFTGVVPRIEDYINASDVVVVPLISGGGTKLKIVQSIACGQPVVTTSVGSEGITEAEEYMTVTDRWESFAEATISAIADPPDPHGRNLQAFRHAYSWETAAKQLVDLIEAQVLRGSE